MNTKPVTAKQVSFIAALVAERNTSAIEAKVVAARAAVMAQTFSSSDASALIRDLQQQPRKAQAQATTATEGIYIIRGEGAFYSEAKIYKVYRTRTSGTLAVKTLDIVEPDCGGCANGEPCEERCSWSGKFRYLGNAFRNLPKEAEKMGLEEAKTFGALYGFCVKCGAILTDEVSKASGIGPVCGADGQWGVKDGRVTLAEDPNACSPGQQCKSIDEQCTRHSLEYQNRYGRAANE